MFFYWVTEIWFVYFRCGLSFVGVYFIVAGRKIPEAIKEVSHKNPDQPSVSIASKIFPGILGQSTLVLLMAVVVKYTCCGELISRCYNVC